MGIAGIDGGGDALREDEASGGGFAEAREELTELEIASDVGGMLREEQGEMGAREIGLAEACTFESEAVACERIFGMGGEEGFESFEAGFWRLGHGNEHGYYSEGRGEGKTGSGGETWEKRRER